MAGFIPSTSTVPIQESRHTFYADASILAGHEGRACTLVLGGNEAVVKLAGDGDAVFGQITTIEIPKNPNERKVVMVTIMGGYRLACAPAAGFVIGDTVVGAGNGLVKKGVAASTDFRFFVSEIGALADGSVGVIKL